MNTVCVRVSLFSYICGVLTDGFNYAVRSDSVGLMEIQRLKITSLRGKYEPNMCVFGRTGNTLRPNTPHQQSVMESLSSRVI